MNKKLNTALFMIVATALNLVIMLVLLFGPLIPYIRFVAPHVDQIVTTVAVIVIFIVAIVGTYLLYNLIMKKFMQKVDMDKYFDPIFRRKQNKAR